MRGRSASLAATFGTLIALFGAACGAVEETPESEKRKAAAQTTATTRTHPQAEEHQKARKKGAGEGPEEGVDAVGDGRGWAWVTAGWSVPSDPAEANAPPLVDQLSVFARPRRPADAVPRHTLELAEAESSHREAFEGRALLDQSRLVIANAGSRNVDIYLVPTTKGFVCSYIVDPTGELAGGLGGCDHALAPEGYTVGMSGTEHRLEVEGLVEDSVRRVEVEVWGRPVEAEVAGNAYHLDTTVEKSCPGAVGAIVLHSPGGVRRIELDHPAAPSAAGETFRIPGCR
jgi:hypothetical protein